MKSDKEKTVHACAESKEQILDSLSPVFETGNNEGIVDIVGGQSGLDSIVYRETSDLLEDAKAIIDSEILLISLSILQWWPHIGIWENELSLRNKRVILFAPYGNFDNFI